MRRPDDERGAAAVEFALVVPVLLLLVFGIIDYGLYFSDSLSARAGVAATARQGAVERCSDMDCLAAYAKTQIDPIAGGATYVKIQVVQVAPNTADWQVGNDLRVCAVTVVDGITGFTPLPQNSTTRSRATMRIEQDSLPRPGNTYAADDPLPPGLGDWSFCT